MTSRRELLKLLAYGTAGAAGSAVFPSCDSAARAGSSLPGAAAGNRPPTDERILVLVELSGGNDGLSTVVPVENGRYRDLRPTLALADDAIVDWGGGWGINSKLAALDRRGLGAVAGVGSDASDLSHFEMQARWWAGSPRHSPTNRTGFLGRLCDQIHGDEPLTGVSTSMGLAPAIIAEVAGTAGLQDSEGLGILQGDEAGTRALRQMFDRFAAADAPDTSGAPLSSARNGVADMLRIVDMVGELPETSGKYPDTEFAHQLAFASRLIRSGMGVRVVHVPMTGADFDSHDDHLGAHTRSLELFASGLDAFLDDLERHQVADRVLVATSSEFGRRPEEHSGGLDHGTASSMLMLGPVVAGLHGEPSSLRKLDDNGNLVPTVEFDRYYATLAEWMDVDPAAVLDRDASGRTPKALDGVLA